MRLTERIKDNKGEERIFTRYVKDNQKLKDEKLCDIEEIEAKIGIEIVDFYKLTQAKKIYLPRFKAYYEINAIDVKTWEIIVCNKKKLQQCILLKLETMARLGCLRKVEKNNESKMH